MGRAIKMQNHNIKIKILNFVLLFLFISTSVLCLLPAGTSFAQQKKLSDVYFDRGVQKYLTGNIEGLIADLEKALEFEPNFGKAKALLVKVLVERGSQEYSKKNYKDALSYFEKAKQLDSNNANINKMYALTNQELYPAKSQPEVVKTFEEKAVPEVKSSATVTTERYDAMTSLVDSFQKQQAKLIESFIKPQEAIVDLLKDSKTEHKEYIKALTQRDDQLVDTYKTQRDVYGKFAVYIALAAAIIVAIILYFLFFTFRRYAKSRLANQEQILMRREEQVIGLLQDFLRAQGRNAVLLAPQNDAVKMLDDPNARVRAKGVEIIEGQFEEEKTKENVEEAVKVIEPLLVDTSNRVRANAAKALYKYDVARALDILKQMLKDKDKWMRSSAAWALGEIATEKSTILLLEFFADKEEKVQSMIRKSLSKTLETKRDELNSELVTQIEEALK
ncbi:MAG: HEAT repeat domain-containing protein [Candidatus Firestonebacteria bacterium]